MKSYVVCPDCGTVFGVAERIGIVCLLLFIVDTPYRNSRRLQKAIVENDVEKVQELLSNGIDPNIPEFYPGKWLRFFETHADTPLAIACEYGNYDIVKLLIDHGATTDVLEYTGWSPLHRTLFKYDRDDLKIVKLLLENGADLEMDEGTIPLVTAVYMFPKTYSYDNNKIVWGNYDDQAARDITEIVKLIIGDKTPNYQFSGRTLLMTAIKNENIPLIKYFLSFECDLNITGIHNGKTAYDYALETGNQEIIDLLS